jgi:peptide/nickel transport system permease protein
MTKFLLRRLLNYVVLTIVATSLAYLLAASTFNPATNYQSRNPPPPPQVVSRQLSKANLNPDTPLLVRYGHWADGVIHGDFGTTWDGKSINAELGRRILITLRLLVLGTIIGAGLGVLVGAYSAVKQYKPSDRMATVGSFVLIAVPVIVLCIVLQVLAVHINDAVGSQLFVFNGVKTSGLTGGLGTHVVDQIRHLILPTIAIVLPEAAIYSRYQRNVTLDVIGSDFVRTARAKGLRRRTALMKHALRAALIPVSTLFAYRIGFLIIGAVFIEWLFDWHGMGEWFIQSVQTNQVNAVGAITFCIAVCILLAGFLSDIVYVFLDPRVRVS